MYIYQESDPESNKPGVRFRLRVFDTHIYTVCTVEWLRGNMYVENTGAPK